MRKTGEIAKGQVALEDTFLAKASLLWQIDLHTILPKPLLLVDTDMYVMKVWSEYVFKRRIVYIEEQLAKRTCDLYLLCNVDLPWEEDALREYPDLEERKHLYNIYKNLMFHWLLAHNYLL